MHRGTAQKNNQGKYPGSIAASLGDIPIEETFAGRNEQAVFPQGTYGQMGMGPIAFLKETIEFGEFEAGADLGCNAAALLCGAGQVGEQIDVGLDDGTGGLPGGRLLEALFGCEKAGELLSLEEEIC
jgi:hypothetical protein